MIERSRRSYPGQLDEIERRRLDTLAKLCTQQKDEAHPILRRGLTHRWWTVREATLHILRAMGKIHTLSLKKDIAARLYDPHHHVRRVASYTLQKLFGDPPTILWAPWYWTMLLLLLLLSLVVGGLLLLRRSGWSGARIFKDTVATSVGALVFLALGMFLLWWTHRDIQAISRHEIYDDSRILPFAMQLLWMSSIVFGAARGLFQSERRQGFSPSPHNVFWGLLGPTALAFFAALSLSLLGPFRLPFFPLFAGLGWIAAIFCFLLVFAKISPKNTEHKKPTISKS
ncbi:MAG: hypothetical protein H6728_07360 [Myxococcales bacterium]|nr:hypothetical protein [Myxococcales bacterium]